MASFALACGGSDGVGRSDNTGSAPTGANSLTTPVTISASASGTSEATASSSGDESTTDGDPTTGGGTAFCPTVTHACIDEAPEGWMGPLEVTDTPPQKAPPGCKTSAYPTPEPDLVGSRGLDAPPAECTCDCGAATDLSCGPASVAYHPDSAICDGPAAATFAVFGGACNTTIPRAGGSHYLPEPIEVQGGSCAATSEVNLPELSWQAQVSACGGAELLEGCATGRVCAPVAGTQDTSQICIWQPGEQECPDGYPDLRTIHQDVVDDRACEACTCGDPIGLCDEAVLRLWTLPNCQGLLMAAMSVDGTCNPSGGQSTQSALLTFGDIDGFCLDSAPQPVGDAVGTDAITVCCI